MISSMVRHVKVRRGQAGLARQWRDLVSARSGAARYGQAGLAGVRCGSARQGVLRCGMPSSGTACRGVGVVWASPTFRCFCNTISGEVRRGVAGRAVHWRGGNGFGAACKGRVWSGEAWLGPARFALARLGDPWRGEAWHGGAWFAKLGRGALRTGKPSRGVPWYGVGFTNGRLKRRPRAALSPNARGWVSQAGPRHGKQRSGMAGLGLVRWAAARCASVRPGTAW
jgi:hypothetical protein